MTDRARVRAFHTKNSCVARRLTGIAPANDNKPMQAAA